ncbi:uncharacterized protein [Linepithema humile]|uniref:uncharacterized protein isoform X2 n=1 Tax=Linepithema humile TaxID=83485 RepID=UPI00351E4D62
MTSNEGICVACYCHTIEDVIKQAHEVYSNLQSILLLQKIKPCLIDKIVDGEKLYSSDRVKNLEDFLNQGKKYLNLANGLDERNQESQMIFAIMLKALDIYSRVGSRNRDTILDITK